MDLGTISLLRVAYIDAPLKAQDSSTTVKLVSGPGENGRRENCTDDFLGRIKNPSAR